MALKWATRPHSVGGGLSVDLFWPISPRTAVPGPHLCSEMALALGSRKAVAAPKAVRASRPARVAPVVRAAAISADVPDMNKRNVMNLILLGGISLPVGAMGLPYLSFFVPPRSADWPLCSAP